MDVLLTDVAASLRLSSTILPVAQQLFLFARGDHCVYPYQLHSKDGMWLFCSFFLVVKVVCDDLSVLPALGILRKKHFKGVPWARMELHYLQAVNFELPDFIHRACSFDALCI